MPPGPMDPSTGDPSLRGSQAELPPEAPAPDRERYDMAPRQPHAEVPADLAIPQARGQRDRRLRLGLWPSVGFAAMAGILVIWFIVFTNYSSCQEDTAAISIETNDAGYVKIGKTWWEIAWLVVSGVFKSIATAWGGYRLIIRGSRCLIDFLSRPSFARNMIENETMVSCIALLGCAILPTAMSAFRTTPLPAFCYASHNILRFWPPRTRNDIKAILDGWIGLAANHVNCEGSVARMVNCKITLGRTLMWMLGVGFWTMAEIYLGPCRYFSLMWRFWFTIMNVSFVSWFLGSADALIVANLEAVGPVHLEMVGYLLTLYIVRLADLKGYCTSPNCW
ncbi:hypothetical protein LZ31DRAFT_81400 [Colletotrichum somersetense]|nr:hypothetical protein LZ31DRAFT_81400 [Colletotrichum somersetense]